MLLMNMQRQGSYPLICHTYYQQPLPFHHLINQSSYLLPTYPSHYLHSLHPSVTTRSTSIFPSCPYPSHTHHTHIYTHPSHASTRLTHFSPFHFVHYMQPAPLPCIPIPHSHRFHHSMQSLTIRTFHTHHFSVIHNH